MVVVDFDTREVTIVRRDCDIVFACIKVGLRAGNCGCPNVIGGGRTIVQHICIEAPYAQNINQRGLKA